MINIVKLFDFKSNRIKFINKLLKLQSHSFVVKLIGSDINKEKLFQSIYNIYHSHGIDGRLRCSDFMFSSYKEKGYVQLKIDKLYYCGQLVTNVVLTTLEEENATLEVKVEDIYD